MASWAKMAWAKMAGANKRKNEKHKFELIYTVFGEGRASRDEIKLDENPLSELTFFDHNNWIEIW